MLAPMMAYMAVRRYEKVRDSELAQAILDQLREDTASSRHESEDDSLSRDSSEKEKIEEKHLDKEEDQSVEYISDNVDDAESCAAEKEPSTDSICTD